MKRVFVFLFLLFLPFWIGSITLAEKGATGYSLLLPSNINQSEQEAVRLFQEYFYKVTGVTLEIVNSSSSGKTISFLSDYSKSPYCDSDSFSIYSKGESLFFEGGKRGILYAVFHFFEEFAGCRFFAPDCEIIPFSLKLEIPNSIHIVETPSFQWREIYCYAASDPSIALKWRLNGNTAVFDSENNRYIRLSPAWLSFVHTAFQYLPPTEWKDSNPQFYSRRYHNLKKMQICFSNPDSIPIVVENIKKDLAKRASQPDSPDFPFWGENRVLYIDFSQMDCESWCICPECIKKYAKYESKMGPILEYVNQLASYFPEYTLTTLSYWYSVKPPKNIKPSDNVRIVLCNIKNYRNRPIDQSSYRVDQQFVQYLKEWSALTNNVFVWDYTINFNHYLLPFPNLAEVQQGNIKMMRDNGVKGVFSQGTMTFGSDMAELRSYLIAKLLWDADCDIVKEENDFIDAYYQSGAPYIKNYLRLLKEQSYSHPLWIYTPPELYRTGYLSKQNLNQYQREINMALQVADNPEITQRLQRIELSLLYVSVRNGYVKGSEKEDAINKIREITEKNRIFDFGEIGYPSKKFFDRYANQK